MPDSPFPEVIKHYRLGSQLGRGAMGLVFAGVDRRDDSPVAIKLLHPHLAAGDANFRERFEREAHVAALLRSPYTVQLIDYGLADGFYFIVMEFVEGANLGATIHNGPMAVDDALRVAGEVAHALEEAGARGIVHRDIKPENILLDPTGRVKVADFGIARRSTSSDLTTPGMYLGTAAYAAPEQMGGTADHRSDIYSLGATLYCMLTGNPPFRGRTIIDVVQQHTSSPVPMGPLAGVPEAAINVIRRCMEKDPLDRYQSASDLAGALERARRAVARALPAGVPTVPEVPEVPTVRPAQPVAPPAPAPAPIAPQPPAAPAPAQRVAPRAPAPGPSPYQTGVQPTVSRESGRIVIRQAPAPVAAPTLPPAQGAAVPAQAKQAAGPDGGPSRTLWLRAAFGLVALLGAGGIVYGILNASGGGGDKSPTPTPTSEGTTPTGSAATTTPPTATAVTAATPLPSVGPPTAVSLLSSGTRAKVANAQNCTAVPVWAQPTNSTAGAYATNRVLKQLCDGDTVVVVTNTPPASTVIISEGFIWWRVLVEGSGEVGWVREIRADGVAPRYLTR